MQYLLKNNKQDQDQNIQPLIKLYIDYGMPVSDFSVKTLCVLFQRFFIICNNEDIRIKCFTWFIQGDIKSVSRKQIQALILRILGVDNMNYALEFDAPDNKNLYDALFNSNEDCILFCEFENSNPISTFVQEKKFEHVEINLVVEKYVHQYFTIYLQKNLDQLKDNDIELFTFIKIIEIIVLYLDITFNNGIDASHYIEDTILFDTLKTALRETFLKLQSILNNKIQNAIKIKYLQSIRNLLEFDLNSLLSTVIRASIDDRFFHCLNNIIYTEIKEDDQDVLCDEDDELLGAVALKHHCIYTLAAFCIKLSNYRAELLDLILDPKTYNFGFDTSCALECINILNSCKVEHPPLGKFIMFLF